MSAADVIESVRPEVEPMQLVERRMIREQLFGVGHGDVSRNIAARSASGAVVSTAPRGTRALAAPRGRAGGSIAKIFAGLLLFGALGALGWAIVNRGEDDEATTVATSTLVPTSAPETTIATTTTIPPIERTNVTADFPIALPSTDLAVDTVNIGAPAAGSSAVLFRAPDGTNVWMAEVDGDPSSTDGLDLQPVGAVTVGTPTEFTEGDTASYQLQMRCGFVLINDAPGQPLFRPIMQQLLEATSVDALATIDMTLPNGWSIVDVGPSLNLFSAQFQVPRGDATVPVVLDQVPGGTIAQLTFGGRQLQATTFLGDDAFIDSAPLFPNTTSVFWRDADTVFNVRSDQLGFGELEEFVSSLQAVEVGDWETRFGQFEPPAPVLDSTCAPQPVLGDTLDP